MAGFDIRCSSIICFIWLTSYSFSSQVLNVGLIHFVLLRLLLLDDSCRAAARLVCWIGGRGFNGIGASRGLLRWPLLSDPNFFIAVAVLD